MADPIGEAYVRLRPTAEGFASSANKLLGGLSFGNVAKGAAAATLGFASVQGAIAGLTGAFRGIVVAGAQFETQLNVFQAVSGATADQMKRVQDEAKALGADLRLPGVSAADAAAAMLELAKGGLTVQQSMDAARGSLQLAKAAGTDFGTAAQVIARNLSAFNLSGTQAAHVADLLAGASIAATGEVSDMAIALQQAGAAAALQGLSIDDTVAAITELAKKGLVGSDAGTSLRVMLLRLIPTTNKAAKAMQGLGVKALDQKGALLPLGKILESYRVGLSKLSQAGKTQALTNIFGQDAIRAAKLLTEGGAAEFDKLEKAVTKAGSAERLTTAQTKGLQGSFQGLQSTLETIGISVAQKINPGIKSIVDGLNNGLVWVQANWPRFEQAISPTIDRVVATVRANWPQVQATIQSVLKNAQAAAEAFVTIIRVLWGRFGGTIETITKVAFGSVLNTIRSVTRIAKDVLQVFADVLQGNWGDAWGALKDIAVTAVRGVWTAVKNSIKVFYTLGTAIVSLIADGVKAAASALEVQLLELVRHALDIVGKIPTKFKVGVGRFSKTIGFTNPASVAADAVQAQIDAIKSSRATKAIGDAYAKNTEAALKAKSRDITQAYEEPTSDAVKTAVTNAADGAKGAATQGGKKLGAVTAAGIDAGLSDGSQVTIDNLKRRLADAVTETAQKVHDAVIQAQRNLGSLGGTLAQQLQQIVDAGPLGQTLKRLQDQLAGRQARQQSKQLRQAIIDAQNNLLAATGHRKLGVLPDRQAGDLRAAVAKAKKDLAKAQAAVAPTGRLTAAQKTDTARFLAPQTKALKDAQAALGDYIRSQRTSLKQAKGAFQDFATNTSIAALQKRQEDQKAAVQKQVSDLVDAFNTGALGQGQNAVTKFTTRLSNILQGQSKAFTVAGKILGTAFVTSFNAQVQGVLAQVAALQKTGAGIPSLAGKGAIPDIVEPSKVMSQQLKVQRDILTELKNTRMLAQKAANKRAEAARAKAAKKAKAKSGGGIDTSFLQVGSTG